MTQAQIEMQIRGIRNDMQVLKNEYNKKMRDLENELINLQNTCIHPQITHHPDASGNNDWEDVCNVCGKGGKRLNELWPQVGETRRYV